MCLIFLCIFFLSNFNKPVKFSTDLFNFPLLISIIWFSRSLFFSLNPIYQALLWFPLWFLWCLNSLAIIGAVLRRGCHVAFWYIANSRPFCVFCIKRFLFLTLTLFWVPPGPFFFFFWFWLLFCMLLYKTRNMQIWFSAVCQRQVFRAVKIRSKLVHESWGSPTPVPRKQWWSHSLVILSQET